MADNPPELQVKMVGIVKDRDLDAFIEQCLGRPWCLQQNGFFPNESLQYLEVGPNPEATAKVEEWLASPPAQCPGRVNQPGFAEDVEIYTETILSELCNRGLLPEGDLTVHVWW